MKAASTHTQTQDNQCPKTSGHVAHLAGRHALNLGRAPYSRRTLVAAMALALPGLAQAAPCINGVNGAGSCTLPASTQVTIEVWGGGGGGSRTNADGSNPAYGGGGGGGGGYCKYVLTTTAGTDTLAITVGAGGLAGTQANVLDNGNPGGNSSAVYTPSVGAPLTVSAAGGGGGELGDINGTAGTGQGGSAGLGCTGAAGTSFTGGAGGNGASFLGTNTGGGGGGSSAGTASNGGAGGTGQAFNGTVLTYGSAGTAPTGGGAGGVAAGEDDMMTPMSSAAGASPGGGGGGGGRTQWSGNLDPSPGAAGGVVVSWVPADTTPPTMNSIYVADQIGYTVRRQVKILISDSDNIGVTGWWVSESSTPPAAGNAGWLASRPTSFLLSSGNEMKYVYAWAKDAAGNVSQYASGHVWLQESVPVPAEPGACGTANGQLTETAPSTGLCATSAGNSNVIEDPALRKYSWGCHGRNDGMTVTCTAPKGYRITVTPGEHVKVNPASVLVAYKQARTDFDLTFDSGYTGDSATPAAGTTAASTLEGTQFSVFSPEGNATYSIKARVAGKACTEQILGGSVSGPPMASEVGIHVCPTSELHGKNGGVVVGLADPSGQVVAFVNKDGQFIDAKNTTIYKTGPLGELAETVIKGLDQTKYSGYQLAVGFGVGTTTGEIMADILTKGRFTFFAMLDPSSQPACGASASTTTLATSANSVLLTKAPNTDLCASGSSGSSMTASNDRYTWACRSADGTLTASCKAWRGYKVKTKITDGKAYTIWPATEQTVRHRGMTFFKITPPQGTTLIATGCDGTLSDGAYKIFDVTADCEVSVGVPATVPSITATATGANTSQTIIGSIIAAGNDHGKQGMLYAAAEVPSAGVFLKNSAGSWVTYNATAPVAVAGPVTLGEHSLEITKDLNVSGIIGTKIYLGYGLGTTTYGAVVPWNNMLSAGTYTHVYTIK